MTGIPTWFGPEARPLLGWWHVPPRRRAHASVVILPPLAFEQGVSVPAFRYLADRLAEEGYAVLRAEVDGMGDSAGHQDDPGRFAAWRQSVRNAIDEARRAVNAPVMLVGMRGGALLAFLAAEAGPPPCALVLWDPPGTGRDFLREQQALRLVGLGSSPDQPKLAFEGLGFELDADDAAEMSSVDLGAGSGRLAEHVLVLTRTGRPRERRLLKRMADHDVTWGEARGQDELLVLDALSVVVPSETCEEIVSWLNCYRTPVDAAVELTLRSCAVVARTSDDEPVVEVLESLGPVGLFGISTRAPRPLGLTVLLIGTESRVGPARLWVETARGLAAVGISTVRFELSGLGDSPVRPGQQPGISYAPEALEDVLMVARHISPEDPSQVLLSGLCSSAYAAVESGLELHARGVCLFNLASGFTPPEMNIGGIDTRRRAAHPTRDIVLRFGKAASVRRAAALMPKSAWRVFDRLGVFRSPAAPLRMLVDAGINVLIWCGADDARRFTFFAGSELKQLESTGRCHFVVDADLDHGMLRAIPRRRAGQALIDQALSLADSRQ